MKKVILFLFAIIVSTISFCQDYNRIIKATKYEYNNKEWEKVSETFPEEEFVILDTWDITIGTYKIRAYGEVEENKYEKHTTYTWKAVNKNGDKCYFMMKKFDPEVTTNIIFSVVYDEGIMFQYETQNQ